jgi:YidC/Oxa1 family membrane protein insertase
MKEAAEQRAIEQKEKLKEQKRLAAEQKKKKAEEARRIKMERNVSTDGISESRVGIRAYAKGRTYDPDRYPVTAYHDPDDIIKEQSAAKAAPSEAAAQQPKKKKKGKEEDKPQGLILNGVGQREPVPTEADDYEPLTEDVAEEILVDEDLDDVPDSEDEKID